MNSYQLSVISYKYLLAGRFLVLFILSLKKLGFFLILQRYSNAFTIITGLLILVKDFSFNGLRQKSLAIRNFFLRVILVS